ncbi:hypothetical protein [Cetobacterium somerae]|uniref:hypothetical protein n=1 Tax=Cetobacterium somerae TaxID=188913 RepID=UPI00248D3BA2|nr:hypothetical protein [Cetobacterium somerae]
MNKKYIYLGSDLQLGSFFLRKNMIISEEALEVITKENKKSRELFVETSKYPEIKANLAFYSKKIEKIFQEVLNGV